jgi:hypothetical protein
MKHKRGNTNWGRPAPPSQTHGVENICAFDKLAEKLQLQPEQYEQSSALRAWVKSNRNRRYVPEWLLLAWNLDVDSQFVSRKKVTPDFTNSLY